MNLDIINGPPNRGQGSPGLCGFSKRERRDDVRFCRAVLVVQSAAIQFAEESLNVRCDLQLLTGGYDFAQLARHFCAPLFCDLGQMVQHDKGEKKAFDRCLLNHLQQCHRVTPRLFHRQHQGTTATPGEEHLLARHIKVQGSKL